MMTFLIVGLGNPGEEYENTWHNMGFMALDKIQSSVESFYIWRNKNNFKAEISEGMIGGKKIILAKPQTFMNNSGLSAKKLFENWKLKIENFVVIHDDIDLPLGQIKTVKSRGSAGHKGVKSIIERLGTNEFWRIRIGICPQEKPKNVEDFVLQKIKDKNKELAESALERTKQEALRLIETKKS